MAEIHSAAGEARIWTAPPVFFVQPGMPLFTSAAEMAALAENRGCSLGHLALSYEAELLGISEKFVNADLTLGGYQNPIPLDETIDAMYAVGKMLPRELKCTALGGLSLAPSGLKIERRR